MPARCSRMAFRKRASSCRRRSHRDASRRRLGAPPIAGRGRRSPRLACLRAARAEPDVGRITLASPKALVFDAYGTLFDVHSVIEAGRALTADPLALSSLWRQKQLEYTWLRSLMGRYEDFWTVTEEALRFALRRLALAASEPQIQALMDAYLSLACFPDVKPA